MKVRKYKLEDCKEIYELFCNTVHAINIRDYTQEQVDAWTQIEVDIDEWGKSFLQNYAIVIEKNDSIIGFGDIDDAGYLDRLYVHKDYQGIGVGTEILKELEEYAKSKNVKVVETYASITSKPVFEKRGYVLVKENIIERRGQKLTRFQMIKKI